MGYTHFGKQADVWKHLSLCEIIAIEQPQTYVETNSAYAIYRLEETPEQQYGIYNFMSKAGKHVPLMESAYYKVEKPAYEDGHYIGSPGLAMSISGTNTKPYIFFDIDEEALANTNDFARKLSLSDHAELYNQDSIAGVMNMFKELPPSTLIHIDPYEIDKPGVNGSETYMDLFIQAANLGLKCVLWYGFNTLNEKAYLNDYIRSKTDGHQIKGLSCTELILSIIEQDSIPCNPGILGSGLLTANVSSESLSAIRVYSDLLIEIYKGVDYRGFNGELYKTC